MASVQNNPINIQPSTLNQTVGFGNPEITEIVASHTAQRPSRLLSASYTTQSVLTGVPLLISDLMVAGFGLLITAYGVDHFLGEQLHIGIWNQLPALLFLQAMLMAIHQLYPGTAVSQVFELRGLVRSVFMSFAFLAAMNALLGELPRREFVTFFIASVIVAILLPLVRNGVRRILSRTRWWGIRAVLVGDPVKGKLACINSKSSRTRGYIPVGYACDAKVFWIDSSIDPFYLGEQNDVVDIARFQHTPVVILTPEQPTDVINRLVFQFPSVIGLGCEASPFADKHTVHESEHISNQHSLPMLRFSPRVCKRTVDLMICIPALIILSPIFLVIAACIKLISPGPVFYGDVRVGQHGKRFRMWKFRTMVSDANAVLEQYLNDHPELHDEWERDRKLKHDPRIIPRIGALMRKWSIDEFPQLWNVVVGEMSLVGPRPVPEPEIVKYRERYYEYTHMWPGITGLWQVSGRNNTTFERRVELVYYYAKNWSPWLDLWILTKTPSAVVSNEGAY